MKYFCIILLLLTTGAGAREFTEINTPNNEPVYQFFHGDKEYLIWVWLDDLEGDPESACIAEPRLINSGIYIAHNLSCTAAIPRIIDEAGGVRAFMSDIFLPYVNVYLDSVGGVDLPPLPDDALYKQFAWIINYDVYYDNGQLYMR